ncbi:hypothetical protein AnigIFM49718_000625 [Aspergillus niger]|nr:hypothetical protein AnigIFM49718_000625 [Aspergillus niger]
MLWKGIANLRGPEIIQTNLDPDESPSRPPRIEPEISVHPKIRKYFLFVEIYVIWRTYWTYPLDADAKSRSAHAAYDREFSLRQPIELVIDPIMHDRNLKGMKQSFL